MYLTNFQKKVYNLLFKIPKGKITTYKLLAKAAGKPKIWRQIGRILKENKHPKKYPCYKVIRSNSEISGYNCGKLAKKKLLQKDGIKIYNNKVRDFEKHLF